MRTTIITVVKNSARQQSISDFDAAIDLIECLKKSEGRFAKRASEVEAEKESILKVMQTFYDYGYDRKLCEDTLEIYQHLPTFINKKEKAE